MGNGWESQNKATNLTTRIKQYLPSVRTKCVQNVPFPKSTRTKLSWFFALLLLCILTVILLCFQTCFERACFGLCSFYNLKPVLGNAHQHNHSYLHYSHTSRRLPTCIVIGVRKAGTRALLTYLNIHPDIVTAHNEIHFFDRDEEYHNGLEYYRKKMPYSFKHQITMEKSPSYFIEPLVPERVYRMNSSILLLLIVRDPVVRLLSDYTQLSEKVTKKGETPVPFEKEVLDGHGYVRTRYKPILTSVYFIHFARWLTFFPMKQLHIVDGEALIDNPYKEMYDIETFLGLEHRINKDSFSFNDTKGFYCVHNGNLSSCLGETKGRKHPYVKPDVLKKLKEFYIKRNEMFFRMVNRTFNWHNTGV